MTITKEDAQMLATLACEHDTLGCGWRKEHEAHTKVGDGRPCCGWPPQCEDLTYNETRFACRCGRFLSESAIRCTDHRDDSRYYGIRTEVEWDCTRCGLVKGEEWEPSLVVIGTRQLVVDS